MLKIALLAAFASIAIIAGGLQTGGESAGLASTSSFSGIIHKPFDPADYIVSISTVDSSAIDAGQRTWIVIHGWNSSPATPNISGLANALARSRADEQVLLLDWSAAADTGLADPGSAENGIVPVGEWAANALVQAGFAGTNLNLIGHSFGSYVADEMARRVPGGVNRIVALDPALDIPGGYDPIANDQVDFARDSAFSWAFHSSSFGSEFTAMRADEAFVVQTGLPFPWEAHSAVVSLFTYYIAHPEDPISTLFSIGALLAGMPGPWLPNQYVANFPTDDGVTKGFEAIVNGTNAGTQAASVDYVPRPALALSRGLEVLTVSWSTNYATFGLESSEGIGSSAPWEPVLLPVTVEGASNVLRLRAEGNRFFRLRQLQ